MAGVKGKSGGPRANSGGARPGAGRPRKNPVTEKPVKHAPEPIPECDMLTLLQDIALGRVDASNVQVRAAIAAVQYTHAKKGESSGAKEAKEAAAKAAAGGRFGQRRGPTLVANGGKAVE